MIRLRALQLAIAAWKTTLDISGKARPRTWLAIAVLHGCIAAAAFWAYQGTTVSTTEIPPVRIVEINDTSSSTGYLHVYQSGPSTWWDFRRGSTIYAHIGHVRADQQFHPHRTLNRPRGNRTPSLASSEIATTSPKIASFSWAPNGSMTGNQSFSLAGSNFTTGIQVFFIASENPRLSKRRISVHRRSNNRVVVQPPCNPPPVLAPPERRVALMVHIFEDLMMLLAVFFAWQQYRLRKSQELLMALQLREIQERFDRLEKDRQQAEKDQTSLIIIP